MSTVELGSLQKTLLLPLWGRAVEAAKANPLLVDRTAAQIVATIDYDFAIIAANIGFVTQLAWIARSIHSDRTVREFLGRHPGGTVVNLGCGLDTTFDRVDNGSLLWYDLDLPDVMELRQRYIPRRERRYSMACSLLDETWMKQVRVPEAVFFLACGVFYYFEEAQIRRLLVRLADGFPASEVLFDAASPRGVRIANRRVIQAGGMDPAAFLKWGLRTAEEMEKWGTLMSDRLGIMSMVYLRLGSCSPGLRWAK